MFLEEHEHDIAKSKQEVAFLEASLAKQKSNMSANGEIFKSSFTEVACISNELDDASMSKYKKRNDSI